MSFLELLKAIYSKQWLARALAKAKTIMSNLEQPLNPMSLLNLAIYLPKLQNLLKELYPNGLQNIDFSTVKDSLCKHLCLPISGRGSTPSQSRDLQNGGSHELQVSSSAKEGESAGQGLSVHVSKGQEADASCTGEEHHTGKVQPTTSSTVQTSGQANGSNDPILDSLWETGRLLFEQSREVHKQSREIVGVLSGAVDYIRGIQDGLREEMRNVSGDIDSSSGSRKSLEFGGVLHGSEGDTVNLKKDDWEVVD